MIWQDAKNKKASGEKAAGQTETRLQSALFPSLFDALSHTFIHGFLSLAADLPAEAVLTTS